MRAQLHKPSNSHGGLTLPSKKRSGDVVQAKLRVNKPGDQHELEADRAADHVIGNSVRTQLDGVSSAPGPNQGKPMPISIRPVPSLQRKEEDVQAKEDDDVQAKEEENVQAKESEVATEGMKDEDLGQEDPIRAQAVQRKEEEPVQAKEDDDVQAKEEESVQAKEEEPVQTKEDDNVQAKEEEPVQAKEDDDVQAKEEESVQAKEDDDVQAKEEEPVQAKEDDDIQAKELTAAPASPIASTPIDQKLSSSKGSGIPLPMDLQTEMETGFGTDFSKVRVHTGTKAESMSKNIGAQAFTHKSDIYFNQGKYDPNSKSGKKLIAHELTHTIQQGAIAPDKASASEEKEKTGTAAESAKTEETATPATENKSAASGATSSASSSPAPAKTDATTPATAAVKGQAPATVEGQTAEGEEVTATPEGEEAQPAGPESDPNFLELTSGIEETAEEETEHDPASKLADNAQESAPSPGNERKSIAQAEQVDEMEQQKPKVFSAADFKSQLMARVDEMQLPENQDEADKFDENNNISEVNKAAAGDAKQAKNEAAGPIEETTNAQPNTAAVPERKTKALKNIPKKKKPGAVDGAKAIPPKRSDASISGPIDAETSKMDDTMAKNNVTDEQLAKSQEPKFEEALASKNTAKEEAKKAPQAFREKETGVLDSTAASSAQLSDKELNAMHTVSGKTAGTVAGNQKGTAKKDTSERERIAGEINAIYETTKKDVDGILDSLEDTVTERFDYFAAIAKREFESYIEGRMAWYKLERYGSSPLGLALWVKDLFVGLPDEVNEFFVEGKAKFVKKMEEGITNIAELVARKLNEAQKRIQKGRNDVADYVKALPKELRHLGKEAAQDIEEKFSALNDDVNSRETALIDTLAQAYVAALEEVDERIEEMKEANKGLVDAAIGFINGVIDTINKLVEMITNLFAAIKSVIGVIIQDPIGFMENLFDGIGKGIDAFKANIQTHLLSGLLEWLTGSLGPMGIVMPKDIFSLSGIFNLVLQVLGLGWDFIRQKAVLLMGEPVVKALESGYDMFKTFATKGIDGIWEFLKDKFSDLKETVIDSIKDMLITQVIQAGIKWLLSLLIPGAGFIKAIMAIKDLIVFFVESAMMLIPAITEAILALAAGSVAGVAKAIEFGLAKLIGLVINLFAKLIGLGGLAKKVQAIFGKIRKRIDKAVNKLLKKAQKAGRKLLGKLGIGAKEKPKNKEQHDEQVKAGLMYLKKQSKAEDQDNNKVITEKEAQKAAAKTKKKFPVFTSITPRNKGGKWVYDWKGSSGTLDTEISADSEKDTKISVGQEISAKYGDRNYRAVIKKVDEKGNKISYEFSFENLKNRNEELSFEAFDKKVKSGDINLSPGKEHNKYKPDPKTIKTEIKDGKFTLSYDYLPIEEGVKPPSFKATISIDEGSLFKHTVNGFGLAVKISGTRGVNTAENSNMEGTHRAHLIADWFRGSGYKNALNIINTSSEYNTGPMLDAEKEIVSGAKAISDIHVGKQVTFDMEVIAEYTILTDQTTLNAFKSHLVKGEKDDLFKILRDNKDPRKTQKVNYKASNFKADGNSVPGTVKAKAGKDKWI